MKRTHAALAVLAIASIVVLWIVVRPNFAQHDTSPNVMTIPLESDLQTLDPSALSDPVTSRVVWQVYEGLLGLSPDGQIVPLLSDHWSTADNRRWVFHVREHVFFHPHPAFGASRTRELGASDVVWSYQRMARGFGSFVFGGLVQGFDPFVKGTTEAIAGITATGSHEVTITLVRPDPSFVHRITSPYLSIMAHEVADADPGSLGSGVAVGTGPFRLVSAAANEVVLERNPEYWRRTGGNVDRLVFRVEKNPQLRVLGFERGASDVVLLPTEFRRRFLSGATLSSDRALDYRLFRAQTNNVHFLGIDVRQVVDVDLRRAIALAIDREAIASRLLDGAAIPAQGPVPAGIIGYQPNSVVHFDRDEAKRALARSSYHGQDLALLVSSESNHPDVAQVVQSDLAAIGVRTRIEVVDFNTFVGRLLSTTPPTLFLSYSEWIYSAPELIMEQFRSTATPNPNLFGFKNAEVDAMLDGLYAITDRNQINARCAAIDAIVATESPAAWLYTQQQTFLGRHDLSEFAVAPNNHWLLEDVRKGVK